MLSSDEHPAIFTYFVGLVVLVMAAVGLSLLIDKRFAFSTQAGAMKRELKLGDWEISELTVDYKNLSLQMQSSDFKLKGSSQTYQEVTSKLEKQQQRRADLGRTRSELVATIASLRQEFSKVRADYRHKTWTEAIGEKLGDLSVRGGRVYGQAIISRVTDVGLEIRHEHGIARIQWPDLDIKLQERFQWDEEERRKLLREEKGNRDGSPSESVIVSSIKLIESSPVIPTDAVPGVPERTPRKALNADAEKASALRKQINAWKQKIGMLRNDKAEADAHAGYGSSHSVPGSLETWEAKAGRLGRDLTKARAALEIAKAQLTELAPTDLLPQQGEEY
jgi:hypothetical protein